MADLSPPTSRSASGPRLTLKELRHVWLLNQSLNFKRAAANAGISQSALSQSIANIEGRLGVALFVRDRRSVESTSFGRIIASQAELVLRTLEDMDRHIDAMRDSKEGEVAFGMGIFLANHLLNPVLAQFHHSYPDIHLRSSIAPVRDLEEQLTRGEIQFFVAGRDPQYRDINHQRELLYRERLVVACRPGHPLLAHAPVNGVDLVRYPAVTYDGSYLRRQLYPRLGNTREFELLERNCPAIQAQQPWLLVDFVQLSDYLLIASRTALEAWLADARLAIVEVSDLEMSIDIELTHRGAVTASPNPQRLIEVIKEVVQRQQLSAQEAEHHSYRGLDDSTPQP
jgi:DNA-binding transcriptional LysR family regulator